MPMHRKTHIWPSGSSEIWYILRDAEIEASKKIESIKAHLLEQPIIEYAAAQTPYYLTLEDIKNFSDALLSDELREAPIKSVILRRSPLSESLLLIIETLKRHPGLNSLVLDRCHLGAQDIKLLVDTFKEKGAFTELNALNLNGNGFGNTGAVALSKLFEAENQIEILDLRANKIGDEGIIALAKALKQNPNLTWLNLKDNPIGIAGINALAEMLKQNRALKELYLGSGSVFMERDSFKELMKALEENKGLIHLEIKRLGLGSKKNMGALASCLKQNTTLTSLELGVNHINDEDVELIAEGLKLNSGLRFLGLEYNAITDEGVAYLAEALKENATLIHLDLSHTLISEAGAQHLLRALRTNHTLLEINLEDHAGISKGTWIDIKECLNRNRVLASKPLPMPETYSAEADTWGIVREYVGKPEDDYLKPILKEEIKTARYAQEEPPKKTVQAVAAQKNPSFFSKVGDWLNAVWNAIVGAAKWLKNKMLSKSVSTSNTETASQTGSEPSKTFISPNQQAPQSNVVNIPPKPPEQNNKKKKPGRVV